MVTCVNIILVSFYVIDGEEALIPAGKNRLVENDGSESGPETNGQGQTTRNEQPGTKGQKRQTLPEKMSPYTRS